MTEALEARLGSIEIEHAAGSYHYSSWSKVERIILGGDSKEEATAGPCKLPGS